MVQKLKEFAKNGQKDTDKLDLEAGFPVNLKPARQWFNFLFNELTRSINQIIDEDYIRHNELVDNLTTNDAKKPLSAKQGKILQDDKIGIGDYGLGVSKTLPNNMLFSDITEENSFWIKGSSPPADSPFPAASKVINIGNRVWNTQLGFASYDNRMAIRARLSSGGSFRPWREVAFIDSNITGNASTATKLATARTIQFQGAATGSVSYDGSANSSCVLTLANSGVVANTYGNNITVPVITVDAKGLLKVVANQPIRAATTTQTGIVQLQDTLASTSNTQALTANMGRQLQESKLNRSRSSNQSFDLASRTFDGMHTEYVWKGAPVNGIGGTLFFNYSQDWIGKLFYSITTNRMYAQALLAGKDTTPWRAIAYLDDTVDSAKKLQTARTVQFQGAATGAFSYDGSQNSTCVLTLANSGVVAGTYGNNVTIPAVNVDEKGLVKTVSTHAIRTATTGQTGLVQLHDSLSSTSTTLAATANAVKTLNDQKVGKITKLGGITKYRDIASFYQGTPTVTGALVIKPPAHLVKTANTMLRMAVEGYNYLTNTSWSANIAGYHYSPNSTWMNTSATLIGNAPFSDIRFARTIEGQLIIVLGDEKTRWAYPSIVIKELVASYTFVDSWADGWSIEIATELSSLIFHAPVEVQGTGLVESAKKLQTARTVQFSGAATGSFSYNGSANSSCVLSLANSGVVAGTYGNNVSVPVITTNEKGLLTVVANQAIRNATTAVTGLVQLNDTLTSDSKIQAATANAVKTLNDQKLGQTENAASASKLQVARNIGIRGAVHGDATFDGSGNIELFVGLTQGLQPNDVTAIRAANTTYINPFDVPMKVTIAARMWSYESARALVSGVLIGEMYADVGSGGSVTSSITFEVGPKREYRFDGKNIARWTEIV